MRGSSSSRHRATGRLARAARDLSGEREGQSTVEYALVVFAFLALLAALASLWGAARDGTLVDIARQAASHGLSQGLTPDALQDIALF
jgi:Flp pilus assembly protein TadG